MAPVTMFWAIDTLARSNEAANNAAPKIRRDLTRMIFPFHFVIWNNQSSWRRR